MKVNIGADGVDNTRANGTENYTCTAFCNCIYFIRRASKIRNYNLQLLYWHIPALNRLRGST